MGYEGICNRRQSFLGGSASDKAEAEEACSFCWPCKAASSISGGVSTCERSWNLPCPLGYSAADIAFDSYRDVPGMRCMADIDYRGPCEFEAVFATKETKEDFAARCETNWPCKQICSEDGVLDVCPEDWLDIGGGVCTAPSYYKYPGCPLLANFRGWTAEMKANFSDECAVRWLCSPDSQPESDCHSLDLSGCPKEWQRKGAFCEPPADVGGPCDKPMRFEDMTPEQKIRWSGDCNVPWPCTGEHLEERTAARTGIHVATSDSGPISGDGKIVINTR